MKRVLLSVLLCLFVGGLSAQAPKAEAQKKSAEQRQQEFAEMKVRLVAYYTAEIGLTPEEAELFWPIFDRLQKSRWKINHERFKLIRPRRADEAPVDFARFNKRILELKVEEGKILEEFHKEMSQVLSPEKMYKFYCAEEKFTRNMTKRIEKK